MPRVTGAQELGVGGPRRGLPGHQAIQRYDGVQAIVEAPADLGENWLGGFYCACHGSRYDLAGRVYPNMPAPSNLQVPPYRFDDENTLTVGLDPEGAA